MTVNPGDNNFGETSSGDSCDTHTTAPDQTDWDQPAWDRHWMLQALELAQCAAALGEVPVGAVLVKDNVRVGAGFNQPISAQDPTAHAEVVALRQAAQHLGNYRMPGTTLYVTLEPCAMCAGALVHGRVERLVYAATEPKAGVVSSQDCFFEKPFLNHNVSVTQGVAAEAAGTLLSHFFRDRREQKRKKT